VFEDTPECANTAGMCGESSEGSGFVYEPCEPMEMTEVYMKLQEMDKHCPKDCTTDEFSAEGCIGDECSDVLIPLCDDQAMSEDYYAEYGENCKSTGTCAGLISQLSERDYACIGGPTVKSMYTGIADKCGGDGVPEADPCTKFQMMNMKMYSICPMECRSGGEVDDGRPVCEDGGDVLQQYGERCQIDSCQSFLREVQSEFAVWEAASCPYYRETSQMMKMVSGFCGAPMDDECSTSLMRYMEIFSGGPNSVCPTECTGDEMCAEVGGQFGAKCQTQECFDALSSFDDKDFKCIAQLTAGDEEPNPSQISMSMEFIKLQCDPSAPALQNCMDDFNCMEDCPDFNPEEAPACSLMTDILSGQNKCTSKCPDALTDCQIEYMVTMMSISNSDCKIDADWLASNWKPGPSGGDSAPGSSDSKSNANGPSGSGSPGTGDEVPEADDVVDSESSDGVGVSPVTGGVMRLVAVIGIFLGLHR